LFLSFMNGPFGDLAQGQEISKELEKKKR
jgi:hypothetical protein